MKKMSLLALLLAACVLLSGCSLITVDKAADAAQIIVDVNGEKVTKGTINSMLDYQIAQNEQTNALYSAYGLSAGLPTDRETLAPVAIDSYVETLVTMQKAKELGLDQMTDEEKAQIEAAAQEAYDADIQSIIAAQFTDSEMTDEEKLQKAQEYATENGVLLDLYIEDETNSKMLEKLEAETVKDVTVTEEELTARLNEKAESAKANYEASLSSFGYAFNNGADIYYTPAGYRMVKQILVKFSDADASAITDAESKLTAAQSELEAADGAENAEDVDKAALEASVAEAQKVLDDAIAAAKANIQPKVDEIMEKVKAEGADFDALVKEYNEDTGMPEKGYAVCEGYTYFVEPFTNAAMALEKVGDVSEPVLSDYGFHILKYDADLQEGVAPLDSVREALTSEILAEKQEECYDNAVAEWIAAADVKTYPEKM